MEDMIEWEKLIERKRNDEKGIYRRMRSKKKLEEGEKENYGLGIKLEEKGGKRIKGNGGEMRGWRWKRWNWEEERI